MGDAEQASGRHLQQIPRRIPRDTGLFDENPQRRARETMTLIVVAQPEKIRRIQGRQNVGNILDIFRSQPTVIPGKPIDTKTDKLRTPGNARHTKPCITPPAQRQIARGMMRLARDLDPDTGIAVNGKAHDRQRTLFAAPVMLGIKHARSNHVKTPQLLRQRKAISHRPTHPEESWRHQPHIQAYTRTHPEYQKLVHPRHARPHARRSF